MSHLFESGFCVRQPSWHKLETVLDDYPASWRQARELAGLAWDPIPEPVYALAGVDDDGQPIYEQIGGFQRVARSDTGATLSVTNDTYPVINHEEMGAIVEAILDQPNVRWETAGCLDGGRMVWALAYLDEPIQPRGDHSPTYTYFSILNRHDAHGRCKILPTNVRIVCANTFAAAEAQGDRDQAAFSFSHTKNWRARLGEAKEAMQGVRAAQREWVKLAERLLGLPVTAEQRERFVVEFIPSPPETLISERVRRNIETARSQVRAILAGETIGDTAGTAYGLVQAAGEYLDHVRTYRRPETYVGRTLLRPEPLKHRAVELALACTN